MKTATDYWLEAIPLKIAMAYVEGDMVTVRKADERMSGFGQEHAFDLYQRRLGDNKAPVSFTRLSRHHTDGSFFLLPPELGKAVQTADFDVADLVSMQEPDVVRIDMERLPAGGMVMTYIDPFTHRTRSSGSIATVALPWLMSEWSQATVAPGGFHDRTEEEQKALYARMGGYWQALMLRYFTLDMEYQLPALLDLAGVKLNFQAKLDLLRGEFREYSAQGIPSSLFSQLLPV